MNELLETERAYVEELLCVLQVLLHSSDCLILSVFHSSLEFHIPFFRVFTGVRL